MSSATWTQLAPGYRTGSLGPLTVVVQEEDGYINATKLCKDAHKNLKNWTRNKDSLALIDAAAELAHIRASSLSSKVSRGPRSTWGTYYHPKLVVHIACWCSPQYAMLVSDIVTEYHAREEKKERKRLEKKLAKRDEKLDRKRVKISDLKEMLQQMEQQAQAREVRSDTKMNRLHDRVDDIQSDLSQVSRKLDVAKRDRVLSTGDPAYENILILLKLNQDPKLFEKGIIPFEYTPLRLTAQSRNACLARKQKAFPKSEIVLELSGTPSAMALWRYYKKQYGHRIDWEGFYFYLRRGYTEGDLINDLRSAHENRLSDIGLA